MQNSITKPDSLGNFVQQKLVDDLRRQVTQQQVPPRQFLPKLQRGVCWCGRRMLNAVQLVLGFVMLVGGGIVGACTGIAGLLIGLALLILPVIAIAGLIEFTEVVLHAAGWV